MQASELEILSQRIREAEERLRRVEEENEDASQEQPTRPMNSLPSSTDKTIPLTHELNHGSSEMAEISE